ncbi:hypothetical protein [Sphingomonas sp. AX6]|uniref:hypothetical protein n=1 Tax=Sphingomonas sp. AX6 TaxID=2653171 RepID=UPI0012F04D10|nr:hypothetical protein [Sphingomonas sp. AX6]VXC91246.1 conserved exported hypothetical protein [Sphingomonas sp. AX6]
MRVKSVFLAAASAAGLFIAGPALAQTTTGGATNIDTNSDDNIQVNDVLDLFVVDNAPDSYSSTSTSSWSLSKSYSSSDTAYLVSANQSLKAININKELDEVADFDGVDEDQSSVGYNSGNNSVNDNAFAAFAGISNNAWNTGLNANTQAATNIAAMGTVNFGVSGCCVDDGTGGGDTGD